MKIFSTAFRLQVTISALFLFLIVPLFSGLIFYTYNKNIELAEQSAIEAMDRARAETMDNIINFMEPLADSIRSTAQLGSIEPNFFRKDASGQYLLRAMQNNPDVQSYYIGFTDGSFRQVLTVLPSTPIFGEAPPAEARYGNRMIDRTKGQNATDHYVFMKDWGQRVGERSAPATYDPRTRDFFKQGVTRGVNAPPDAIFVTDPFASLSTGKQQISISSSMISEGKLVGVAAVSLTLQKVSSYLTDRRVSPNSVTFIVDANDQIIVAPEEEMKVVATGKNATKKLTELGNPVVSAAVAGRIAHNNELFKFRVGEKNEEYIALFAPFPASFYKPSWKVVVISPLNDFVGHLKENNQKIMVFGGALLFLAIFMTYLVSKHLSRPLERLVHEIKQVLSFQVSPDLNLKSRVSEIRLLIDATQKLKTAVSAFAAYVPRELVSDLIHSGLPIAPGGQSRYLTMFFTDLQGFSSLAEITPTRELLKQISDYLELVTLAVKEEQGTIDKFIGDSVMAFWGAPTLREDHAYRACVAAVRSQRRMQALNEALMEAGKNPLTVRVGIHTDAVLVGNIGSLERLSYTVMGDGVNIASRLEGINKDFGTRICVSHTVFKEAGERLWLRPIDTVSVKGRKGEFLIYELVGIRDGDEEVQANDREKELCAATVYAFSLYSQGMYDAAIEAYQQIDEQFDDGLAREMIARCQAAKSETVIKLA